MRDRLCRSRTAPLYRRFQPRPTGKVVFARDRELRCAEVQWFGNGANPSNGAGATFDGHTKKFASLSAKLIEIGTLRQLAHRVFLRAGVRSQALKENGLRQHVCVWRWTQSC